MAILKEGKTAQVCRTVDKFGLFFTEEYKHFINVHNMAFPSQFADKMSEARLPNLQNNGKDEHVQFNKRRPREEDQLLDDIEAIVNDSIDLDASLSYDGTKKRP